MSINMDGDNDQNCNSEFYCKGKCYWQNVEANIDGMLGGFSSINTIDSDESRGLLKKLLKQNDASKPRRVLDCGAGENDFCFTIQIY